MARQPKYSHVKGIIPVTITGDGRIFATRKRSASKFNTCVGDAMRGKEYADKDALSAGLKAAVHGCGGRSSK